MVAFSPVNLSKNNIQRSNNRDNVCHHRATRHVRQRRKIHETWSAEMNARRLRASCRFNVNTEFALRSFNRVIDFAGRNVDAFGHQQEVMNQRVHVRLHRFPIREHNFRRVGFDRPRFQARQRLLNDLVRLAHLAHAHQVARPNVAVVLNRNFKIVIFVTAVRVRAAIIQFDAAAA